MSQSVAASFCLIGNQLDLFDGSSCPFGGNPKVRWRLRGARVGVVSEPGKEGCYGVGTTKGLNVVQPKFDVQIPEDRLRRLTHCCKNPLWAIPVIALTQKPTCALPPF